MKKLIICYVFAISSTGIYAQDLSGSKALNSGINYAVNVSANPVPSPQATTAIMINLSDQSTTDPQDGDALRTKNISRTFPIGGFDKVSLDNQFGSITIKTWERREAKIDIAINAYSSNDKEAQNLIDQVNVDAGKNGDLISCKTTIDGGQWGGRNKRREIKVNYVVYMPASNPLSLSQKFGNVNMGSFSGPLNAKVQYGDFNAGNLSGVNNDITVQYGGTNIQEMNRATVKQQYGSGLTIGTVANLDLNAQYTAVNITTIKGDAMIKQQYGSGLKIGTVNNLTLDVQYANANVSTVKGTALIKQQYNSLTIGSVGKLNLHSQYTGITIGTLRGDGNFKMSYNDFRINEIGATCRNLNINADYVDVDLAFAGNYNGDFSVRKSYGSFKYSGNVRTNTSGENDESKHSSTKSYFGKIGGGGAATVQVQTSYGSVTFK